MPTIYYTRISMAAPYAAVLSFRVAMARHPRHNLIMEDVTARIVRGDCATALRDCTDNYFDLIVTSPPYADQRKTTYGGVKAEHYNQWFLEKNCHPGKVIRANGRVASATRGLVPSVLSQCVRKPSYQW